VDNRPAVNVKKKKSAERNKLQKTKADTGGKRLSKSGIYKYQTKGWGEKGGRQRGGRPTQRKKNSPPRVDKGQLGQKPSQRLTGSETG